MRYVLLAAAIGLAAVPGAARDRNFVPEATPAGTPVHCVNIRNIRTTHVRNDEVIDFVMAGGRVYRNVLPGGGCPGLGFEKRFMYRTSISQLCSVDIITVLNVDGGGLDPRASCGLGQFQPVTLASR